MEARKQYLFSSCKLELASITGVEKFLSKLQTFLLARSIGYAKNRWSKPKCTSDRDTTKDLAFCYLLLKQELQL